MEFKILTKTERKLLRMVRTFPHQAEKILRRNQALLEYVDGLPTRMRDIEKLDILFLEFRGEVGCPHCLGWPNCPECSWDAIVSYHPRRCFRMTFGGVSVDGMLHDFAAVHMGIRSEEIEIVLSGIVDASRARQYRKELRLIKRFLVGHIEWAQGVLCGEL